MSDTRIRDVARTILDSLATGLEAAGISVPEKRNLAAGDHAHDFTAGKCAEQLAVGWDGSYQGTVSPSGNLTNAAIKCAVPLTAQYTCILTRCVPTLDSRGRPPSAAELTVSAEEIMLDAMTIATVAVEKQIADSLTGIGCSLVGIGQLQAIGPLGGVGGVQMTLQVTLV